MKMKTGRFVLYFFNCVRDGYTQFYFVNIPSLLYLPVTLLTRLGHTIDRNRRCTRSSSVSSA
jgi:hypothetical protein